MLNIGKVTVQQNQRTIIADPNFKTKPNVALSELTDTNITEPEDGEVLVYDATSSKFVSSPLGEASVSISSINGGFF